MHACRDPRDLRRVVPRWLAIAVLIVAVAGCASLTRKTEPPTVSLAGIQLLELGLLEQRYLLRLRIQNPNDFALPIEGMDYRVVLNDAEFARGVSRHDVSVPAFDSAILEVEGVSNLSGVFSQLQRFGAGPPETFTYALTGNVKLSNFLLKLPFAYRGEINLTP
jgi:LEA14-like dessication related protein